MEETEGGYIIANRKSQDVFGLMPPMQKLDVPETPEGSGAKRTKRVASVSRSDSPGRPRFGPPEE
jgi:hypothetical protein